MHSPEFPVLVPHLHFRHTQYSEIFDDFLVTIPSCYTDYQL